MHRDVKHMPAHDIQPAELIIEHQGKVHYRPVGAEQIFDILQRHPLDIRIFNDGMGVVEMKTRRKGIGIRNEDHNCNQAKGHKIKHLAPVNPV